MALAVVLGWGASVAGAALPDGRVYEMVTPAEKGGGSPWFDPATAVAGTTVAARDGDSLLYYALLPFPGSPTGQIASYKANRGADGHWLYEPVSPATVSPFPRRMFGLEFEALAVDATPDLRYLFTVTHDSLTPDDQDDPGLPAADVYERDPSGAYLHVSRLGDGPQPPRHTGFDDFTNYQGSSADGRHVLFVTNRPYAPAAAGQVDGVSLYDRHDGELDIVGVDDAGVLTSPCGSQLGSSASVQHAVSDDGRRAYFTSPMQVPQVVLGSWSPGDASCLAPAKLYLRTDNASTVEISRSRRTPVSDGGPGPDPGGSRPADYVGAAVDGSKAFFTSRELLTDDAGPNGNAMLYEYDASTDVLSFIAPGLVGPKAILGVSHDGDYVYFLSNAILNPGHGTSGKNNLYVSHDGAVTYIATLGAALDGGRLLSGDALQKVKFANMTPNGHVLVFLSNSHLTSYDSGGNDEVYRYDAVDGSLVCVSCSPSGAAPIGGASLIGNTLIGTNGDASLIQKALPQDISEDGSRVFFQTQDQLVPEDLNRPSGPVMGGRPGNGQRGGTDVYEWHDGVVSLISSGTSAGDSWFVDSASNGRDVFFTTDANLSWRDTDGGDVDIYDARVGGNPDPAPVAVLPCGGDGCRGVLSGGSDGASPGSGSFDGPAGVGVLSFHVGALSRMALGRLAAGRRVGLMVRLSAGGRVSARLVARLGRHERVVASASRSSAGGSVRLGLRLSAVGRRALVSPGVLRVRLVVRVSGVDRVVVRRLVLHAPASAGAAGGRS